MLSNGYIIMLAILFSFFILGINAIPAPGKPFAPEISPSHEKVGAGINAPPGVKVRRCVVSVFYSRLTSSDVYSRVFRRRISEIEVLMQRGRKGRSMGVYRCLVMMGMDIWRWSVNRGSMNLCENAYASRRWIMSKSSSQTP